MAACNVLLWRVQSVLLSYYVFLVVVVSIFMCSVFVSYNFLNYLKISILAD